MTFKFDVRNRTRNDVIEKIAELLDIAPESISDDAALFALASSSIRLVELVIELQEEFDVCFHQADMNRIGNVGDLIDLVVTRCNDCVAG